MRNERRQAVRAARDRLPDWLPEARVEAYDDRFAGDDPLLSHDDLRLLDRLDSELSRLDRGGLWGADEYGVLAATTTGVDAPRVVCVYHPEVPDDVASAEGVSDEREERLNDALWEYCERVADYLQAELDAFLDETT